MTMYESVDAALAAATPEDREQLQAARDTFALVRKIRDLKALLEKARAERDALMGRLVIDDGTGEGGVNVLTDEDGNCRCCFMWFSSRDKGVEAARSLADLPPGGGAA